MFHDVCFAVAATKRRHNLPLNSGLRKHMCRKKQVISVELITA